MKTTALHSVKFSRLKRRLKMPSYQVVGVLEALWLMTSTNAPDGAVGRYTNEDIAAILEWEGCPNQLVKDLVESGWLDEHPEHRLVVHDWAIHCPNFVKGSMKKHGREFATHEILISEGDFPEQGAKQGARQPARQAAKQGADSTEQGARQHAPSTHAPNLTKPNLTKPLSLDAYASSPELQKSSEEPPAESSPIVCEFPTNGYHRSWALRESQVATWREAFPGLDVAGEARKALGWIQSNPERKKTAKGMPRFLYSWLSRANDRTRAGPLFAPKPTALEKARESADLVAAGKSSIANTIFTRLQQIDAEKEARNGVA